MSVSPAETLDGLSSAPGHRTLAEKAFATLHEAIITGVLAPGQRLPIEELAERLEMSPMPIRESLRHLDAVGLVEHVPHRGARVTELSIKDLQEVYDARLALEPLAVRHAAERFTEADAERAQGRLQEHVRAYRAGVVRDVWTTHTAFHFALYEAADSRWLIRLVLPLWESSERYRYTMLPIRTRIEGRRDEHERILQACIDHDAERAEAELHDHLARTANTVATEMGGEQLFELRLARRSRAGTAKRRRGKGS
jgi:DNA-binding GntR family transcriptional regulator